MFRPDETDCVAVIQSEWFRNLVRSCAMDEKIKADLMAMGFANMTKEELLDGWRVASEALLKAKAEIVRLERKLAREKRRA